MTSTPGTQGSPTPEELRAEIDQTRVELAETVDALTAKLDVKSQARQKVDDVRTSVRARVTDQVTLLSDRVTTARQSAPVPVQNALDKAGSAAAPLVAKAKPYNRQILVSLAGSVLLLLIVRRRSS
ncbi:MAG: hypothetical protein QOE60_1090 [Thermoleophilaceae bacterium]|nr:hypothetical protein [Thermoleophilaceae bacterium]